MVLHNKQPPQHSQNAIPHVGGRPLNHLAEAPLVTVTTPGMLVLISELPLPVAKPLVTLLVASVVVALPLL